MKRGEIWLVGLDPAAGHEQKGRRPVLIVSPEAFNHVTKVPVVLPITSGGRFARAAGFAVPLTGAGTKTTGVIRCDQPRASKSRRNCKPKSPWPALAVVTSSSAVLTTTSRSAAGSFSWSARSSSDKTPVS